MGIARNTGVIRVSMSHRWAGRGYLAGDPPVNSDPDSPDGRFKILNVPSTGRIVVVNRATMSIVAMVRSKADGTWRVSGLSSDLVYTVIGLDDRGLQNAAIQDWVQAALEG